MTERVGVDGLARVFDHVRVDHRADGTLAARTLLATEYPGAAIVIDYDRAGAVIARHEINLPDRPYARVDILYDSDGAVAERTRSGFATGDIASVTVRFDPHGTIAAVEHLQVDGSRTIVGTSAETNLAGSGDDRLVARGDADTVVLLDPGPHPLAIAGCDAGQFGGLDMLGEGGPVSARFEHVSGGVLGSSELDGAHVGDAIIPFSGVHPVTPPDLIV